jgi:hypothetical protein
MSFHLSLVTREYHPVHPKQFSEPMVCLAQTVHLSCTKTNTMSKRTKMRFYMTHVNWEFQQVRSKWFLRLWYVWCKLCIYLAPRLTLSPNGLKRDSTWPTWPSSSIRCVQKDFWGYGTFGANCNHLAPRLTLSPKGWKRDSTWPTSPSSSIRCVQKDFWGYGTFGANCNHLAPRLTLSPKGWKRDSTWPTSPRTSIRCVQNSFWSYSTFGENCGSILHRY